MRARLGPKQAIVATAHKIARTVYHLLKTGEPRELDAHGDNVYAFLPPAMSLAGSVMGLAIEACGPLTVSPATVTRPS